MPIDLSYPALGWFGEVALHRGATVLRQVAPPTVEPIVLVEAKAHLKATENTAEDALIQGWIVAARQHVEAVTGRAMCPQDWELRLSGFPGRCEPIELPMPPFVSLLSVSTYDVAGTGTALSAEGWQVDAPSGDFATPALLYPGAAAPGPSSVARLRGAVRIRYRAGYTGPGGVPAPLRAAMFLLIGEFFENREGTQNRNLQANPAVERLLTPYRLPRIL